MDHIATGTFREVLKNGVYFFINGLHDLLIARCYQGDVGGRPQGRCELRALSDSQALTGKEGQPEYGLF